MAVAHSTFQEIVNTILQQSGLPSITSAATFNARTGLLRPQLQAILYTDDADAKLMVRLTDLFAMRQFSASTTASSPVVSLDDICDIEGVQYHTVRCNGQPMRFLSYNEYRSMYATDADVPEGAPMYWSYKNTPSADAQRANQIIMIPTPDAAYVVEYGAKILHKPLALATDVILWPKPYEHVLVAFGRAALAEARKTGDMSGTAQAALDNVRQWAIGPQDKPLKANFGGLSIGLDNRWTNGSSGYDWSNHI